MENLQDRIEKYLVDNYKEFTEPSDLIRAASDIIDMMNQAGMDEDLSEAGKATAKQPSMSIDMQKATNDYLEGRIEKAEFNRLNSMQLLATEGHKIMAQETCEYLLGMLAAAAPPPLLEKLVDEFMRNIQENREKILKAFLAEYQCKPDEVEQITYPTPEGGSGWRVRKITPASGIPLPNEIIEALRAADRALIGADACPDPECGSDQCAALQMIRKLVPTGGEAPAVSHAERHRARREDAQAKAPAARPSLTLEQAGLKLEQAIHILNDHGWNGDTDGDAAGKVNDLVQGFRDRWFAFHENNLLMIEDALPGPKSQYESLTLVKSVQNVVARFRALDEEREAIENALPAPMDNLGATLPEAVAALTKSLEESIKQAEGYRQTLADQAEAAGESSASFTHDSPSVIPWINAIVQEWYASSVGLAVATAPAKLHRIGEIINSEAARLIKENKELDEAGILKRRLEDTKWAFDLNLKTWAPIVAICQENGKALKLNPGGDIAIKVLEIIKEYIAKNKPEFCFGDNGTCQTCGQLPENHGGAIHEFRPGHPRKEGGPAT